MSNINQENTKEILQKTADELHQKAQQELKKIKTRKAVDYTLIGLCSLWYILAADNFENKNTLLTLMLIGTMISFIGIDYKQKKEKLKHDILWGTMQKEVELKDHMTQKKQDELEADLNISNNELAGFKQRGLASTALLGSLLTLGGGFIADKLSLPTATLAGSLIMTASAYWMKQHYQTLNHPLNAKFNKMIQLKELASKERE